VYTYTFPTGSANLKNRRIAIQSIVLPYSWYNVNGTIYNNASFQLTFPISGSSSTTLNISLPNGFYQISDINSYIQTQMVNNNFYLVNASGDNVYYIELVANESTGLCQIISYIVPTSLPSNWALPTAGTGGWGSSLPNVSDQVPQLTTLSNNFGKLIGFANSTSFPSSPTQTGTTTEVSSFEPQITPVSSVLVGCSLINNVLSNPTNLMTCIPITSTFGAQIIYQPYFKIDIDVLDGSVNSFNIIFYDQLFNQLQITDTNVTINLWLD